MANRNLYMKEYRKTDKNKTWVKNYRSKNTVKDKHNKQHKKYFKNLTEEKRQRYKVYLKNWRKNNPDKQLKNRRRHELKILGWTLESYKVQYKKQKGLCAICKRKFETLRPDHDHKNGKARELLCYCCNTGLGLFQDNPKILKSAATYLDRHNNG